LAGGSARNGDANRVNEQIDVKVQRPALKRAVGSRQAVKILTSIWLSF
jgi:hypothetical protein